MINIGASQVALNRGARQGLKTGMKMIVLRKKEIVGYLQVQEVTAIDAVAKIIKSFQGLAPEDKVRAIYEMPAVITMGRAEPHPAGPPSAGVKRTDTLKKFA